ncbi:MAG: 5-(carboxyamino)imidazole ribonucleotide synthase [Bradyrhizobium sp.]|nr:MAG: 5-(carboxyamino)imidazole ribonucleotide synthase [Bradyrhizobium sp.]
MLAPGATIGILGSGQLGRMLAMAALKLGLRCHIYAPEPEAPAYDAASARTVASFDDEAALARFAESVDVITYEFENVPIACVEFLARLRPVRPDARALAVSQDRLAEKTFLRGLGLATAPFRPVDAAAALGPALAEIGRLAVLKTRRLGYDGKGQAMIREGSDLEALHRKLGGGPMIVEGFVAFDCEASVIAARSLEGAMVAFDLCENEHDRHILARTHVPARVAPEIETAAKTLAAKALEALDYVGVLAIELFVARDGAGAERLVVNEIAPRVHNSGHWTIEGAQTSQFEQHIRAIAGWPLGATARRGRVEMVNLIGEQADEWRDILAQPEQSLHLYGKLEARPGRKMGHVTRVFPEGPRNV